MIAIYSSTSSRNTDMVHGKYFEDRLMKKHILSLSVAAAIALTGVAPFSYADDDDEVDCDGILVQSRFALANCMVESALAIAAAAASDNGCEAGEWAIESIVPELAYTTIPVQGLARVYNGDDFYELTGQSSAQLQNNVNCQVNTTTEDNTFDGEDLTYSAGSGNYYLDAVIDKDAYLLCITQSVSDGNIALGDEDFEEDNHLLFSDDIEATGMVTISQTRGRGNRATTEVLSGWAIDETADIPDEVCEDLLHPENCDLGEFSMTATTNDIGSGCQIEVEGTILNLLSYIVEHESGGLTIAGTLSVGPANGDDDDEEDDEEDDD